MITKVLLFYCIEISYIFHMVWHTSIKPDCTQGYGFMKSNANFYPGYCLTMIGVCIDTYVIYQGFLKKLMS